MHFHESRQFAVALFLISENLAFIYPITMKAGDFEKTPALIRRYMNDRSFIVFYNGTEIILRERPCFYLRHLKNGRRNRH